MFGRAPSPVQIEPARPRLVRLSPEQMLCRSVIHWPVNPTNDEQRLHEDCTGNFDIFWIAKKRSYRVEIFSLSFNSPATNRR